MTEHPVIATNGQIDSKVFIYKVKTEMESFHIAIVAPSATVAKESLLNHIPNCLYSYECVATKIMQVQG